MKNAKEFNVYDKISKGEYVCRGDKVYTKDEMREMLRKSGLTRGEVETLWMLNADDAIREVRDEEEFLTIQQLEDKEEIYLSNESWTVREFYTLEKTKAFLFILVAFQAFFYVAYFIACKLGGDPADMQGFAISLMLLIVAYASSFAALQLLEPKWWKEAKADAAIPEEALRDKAKDFIKKRQEVMSSVFNTILMYECMEEYLMDE